VHDDGLRINRYIDVAKVIPRMCMELKFSGESKNIPESVRRLTELCSL